jgi:hypothetical protein
MGNIKEGKLLYHLTKTSNLDSIIENGLMPRRRVSEQSVPFADVADPNIISKRTLLNLQDFVPFHFHPYSAFDVAVKRRYGKGEFIYICILREKAKYNKYKILPIHPLSPTGRITLYEYDEGFKLIDWDTMHTPGNEERYKKHVKMAECLTNKVIQAKSFQCIYVQSEATRKLVEWKLRNYNINSRPPYVNVGRWFGEN